MRVLGDAWWNLLGVYRLQKETGFGPATFSCLSSPTNIFRNRWDAFLFFQSSSMRPLPVQNFSDCWVIRSWTTPHNLGWQCLSAALMPAKWDRRASIELCCVQNIVVLLLWNILIPSVGWCCKCSAGARCTCTKACTLKHIDIQ